MQLVSRLSHFPFSLSRRCVVVDDGEKYSALAAHHSAHGDSLSRPNESAAHFHLLPLTLSRVVPVLLFSLFPFLLRLRSLHSPSKREKNKEMSNWAEASPCLTLPVAVQKGRTSGGFFQKWQAPQTVLGAETDKEAPTVAKTIPRRKSQSRRRV